MDEKVERLVAEFAEAMEAALGESLISLILYGSAASGSYTAGRSDVNFLVVAQKIEAETLGSLIKPLQKWGKQGVAIPLFMEPMDIMLSLDSFPLEFLDMKSAYQVVKGEDPLAGIVIAPEHLRLQCEREIKGKQIQLRRGYLALGGRPSDRDRLFRDSIKAFLVIMRGMLWLKDRTIVRLNEEAVMEGMEKQLGHGLPHLRKILEFKTGNPRLADTEAHRLFSGYLDEVKELAAWIDAWQDQGRG